MLATNTAPPRTECEVECLSETNRDVDRVNFDVSDLEGIRDPFEAPPFAPKTLYPVDLLEKMMQRGDRNKRKQQKAKKEPNLKQKVLFHSYNPCTRIRKNRTDYEFTKPYTKSILSFSPKGAKISAYRSIAKH